MRIEPVDERDSGWEDPYPRFRVYIFRGGDEPFRSWSTRTDDVTDADVSEVIAWAREQAGAVGLYAVALVGERTTTAEEPQRGLVWLVGVDANDNPRDETEQQWFEAMLRRRDEYPVAHHPEPVAAALADAPPERVRVSLPANQIEDGSLRPAVGDPVTYSLNFNESDDPDDDLAAEWDFEAEPLEGGAPNYPRLWDGHAETLGPPFWPVRLRGRGWGAMWHAPRSVSGPVRLRGHLSVYELNLGPTASVIGRIERLWVTSQTVDQSDGNHHDLSKIVPGSRRLAEVQISPRWFDRGHGRPDGRPPFPPGPGARFVFSDPPLPPTPWVCETGVLVELSLAPDLG